MTCQICGNKSGFYPLCNDCFKLRDNGQVTKCEECGIWKKGDKPLCKECWLIKRKEVEKKKGGYIESEIEIEENNFRNKFKPDYRTQDGHMVRSKAEMVIDDWLYHKGIVHAYERQVPIEEVLYCDFFIPTYKKVWIEFWGLEDDKYLKRKELKIGLYKKYEKELIELNNKDIERLDDVLPKKLRKYLPKNFSFD